MKHNTSIIVGILAVLLLSFTAAAQVDVAHTFNTNNVEVNAYNCADNACSSVTPFSGTFPDGQTTNNGELIIRFPSSPSPYGYAVYFFAEDRVPIALKATWHTHGEDQLYGPVNVPITFNQINSCSAQIDSLEVLNDARPNIPLVIKTVASLDANVNSPFSEKDNGIKYIPADKKQVHYGADTKVTLQVRDASGTIVHRETQELNAANNNALLLNEKRELDWTWTPQTSGRNTIAVTTEVTDSQCTNSINMNADKQIRVQDNLPRNQYYTLLNNLEITPVHSKIGDTITISFDKTTNKANDKFPDEAGYQLTPAETSVRYLITSPSGNRVMDVSKVLTANADNTNPSRQTFSFTATEDGTYTVRIEGSANADDELNNPAETISANAYVSEQPAYALTIQLVDALTGKNIPDARVRLNGQTLTTNNDGRAQFTNLQTGTYTIEATQDNYKTLTGSVEIKDVSLLVAFAMQPQKTTTPTTPADDKTIATTTEKTANLKITNVRVQDTDATSGSTVSLHINVKNTGKRAAENIKITATILELATRATSKTFDLSRGETGSERLLIHIPEDAASDTYYARIVISSDDGKIVEYRQVRVQ